MKKQIQKVYDELAPHYFESRTKGTGASWFYNENLEMPTTLKLIGNIKNKKILDLGCGPGRYAKILSEKGGKVIGIDNSKTSLNIAKKEAPNAKFIFGDIEKLPFRNNEFDIIISTLALGHLKNWNKTLNEINRVLKKEGTFIFSNYNPVTENYSKKKWFFKKFYVIEDYFSERANKQNWKGREMVHYHKTFGTIVKLIIKHNFEIIDYEDSYPISISKKKFPRQYKEASNVPIFCTWKLRKK